ncbi:MAG: hypothetical protein O2795_20215 [Acidobacteria bacterium]|nr:hypothetical protein [Acidobacteriota bacterium]
MRRTLGEWTFAALIALLGLIFVGDYQLGWPASRTWPAFLIVWGCLKAAAGMVGERSEADYSEVSLPRRPSVFGPRLLILLGVALLVNNYYDRFSLSTLIADGWPWILVVWGCSWMAEDAIARSVHTRQPRPLGGGALVLALLVCLIGIGLHGAFAAYGILDF